MKKHNWNLNDHKLSGHGYMFEPTISIFDKAVVICFQKVGTRFFLFLSNWPKSINEVYNQYQINISYDSGNNSKFTLNTETGDYNTSMFFLDEHKNTFSDINSFLQNNGGDMNTFFFNNEKDMYFVIRDPIVRFLSGISQIASSYVGELLTQPEERIIIKSLSDITDGEIDHIYNNYNHYFNEWDDFTENNLSNVDINIFVKIIVYIINHKPYLYFYDAHTQHYLSKYKDLIYNIKDKTKIKIIDLADCNKKSAYNLFNTWSDNIDYINAYNNTTGHIVSNKKLYNHIKFLLNSDDSPISQSLYYFLLTEIKEYEQLKNSKYFIKL